MQYEQWRITVTWTFGFTLHPGTGGIRFTIWFTAFDTDYQPGPAPHASVMLLTNVGYVAGHWHEYDREIPIERVRPGLSMLKRLGLPGGQLEGGGVSEGTETWDNLSVLIELDDGSGLAQCVLGGYDWDKTLPAPLREFLGDIAGAIDTFEHPLKDVRAVAELLTRNPS